MLPNRGRLQLIIIPRSSQVSLPSSPPPPECQGLRDQAAGLAKKKVEEKPQERVSMARVQQVEGKDNRREEQGKNTKPML